MTKEEEFVIGMLEHCQNTYIEDTLVTHLQLTTEEAKILLNLISKQQDEIKELKLDLHEMTISNNHKKEYWVHKNILNSYVSKNKIKAKIEELKTRIIGASTGIYAAQVDILEEILNEEQE